MRRSSSAALVRTTSRTSTSRSRPASSSSSPASRAQAKSSLVFDTLYAEGQRRYVETFSPYARQFLDRMDKPAVDRIEGIPAGHRHRPDQPGAHLALHRRHDDRAQRPPEAAVRARANLFCRGCGKPVRRDSPDSICRRRAAARAAAAGRRLLVCFPVEIPKNFRTPRCASCCAPGLHAHPRGDEEVARRDPGPLRADDVDRSRAPRRPRRR